METARYHNKEINALINWYVLRRYLKLFRRHRDEITESRWTFYRIMKVIEKVDTVVNLKGFEVSQF